MIHLEEVSPSKTNGGDVVAAAPLDPFRPLRSDRLAIVGFSETTRHSAPYDDPDVEIWICNRLGLQPGVTRWDRHFDTHPLEWSARNHKPEDWRTYKEWLERDHGDRLVYLKDVDSDVCPVPNAVVFPADETIAGVGREYFTSAIGWQIGLALLLKPRRLELYGVDLRHIAEYEFQRPNAEWLLGVAEGRGIEVVIPDESALLNADGRSPLYGIGIYSGELGSMEKALEARVAEIDQAMGKLVAENDRILKELDTWHGARQEAFSWHERVLQYRRGGKL